MVPGRHTFKRGTLFSSAVLLSGDEDNDLEHVQLQQLGACSAAACSFASRPCTTVMSNSNEQQQWSTEVALQIH